MLDRWVRGSKIVLKANPDYPAFEWNFEPPAGDAVEAREDRVRVARVR